MADASGGRFILGLGAGWYEPEYTAFGLLFTEKVGRLAETLEALARPLRGEQVTLSERHLRLRDANVMVSTPPLPIWIAASGPRMLQLTARYADGLERGLVWSGSEPVPAARRRALGSNGRLRPATRCDRDLGQPFRYSGTSRIPGRPDTRVSAVALCGDVDEIAGGLRAYEKAGAQHVMLSLARVPFQLQPPNFIEWMARAFGRSDAETRGRTANHGRRCG